jgi:antitoxin ParD1/3/4
MNISLTPELERYIQGKVASGGYNNASEVIRESLRALQEHEAMLARWRAQIEEGYQQSLRGEVTDGPTAVAKLRRKLK